MTLILPVAPCLHTFNPTNHSPLCTQCGQGGSQKGNLSHFLGTCPNFHHMLGQQLTIKSVRFWQLPVASMWQLIGLFTMKRHSVRQGRNQSLSLSASPRQTCSRIPGAQPPVWPPQWPGCRMRKVALTPAAPPPSPGASASSIARQKRRSASAAVSAVSGGGGPCCAALPPCGRHQSLQVSWLGPVWALTAAGESGGEACVCSNRAPAPSCESLRSTNAASLAVACWRPTFSIHYEHAGAVGTGDEERRCPARKAPARLQGAGGPVCRPLLWRRASSPVGRRNRPGPPVCLRVQRAPRRARAPREHRLVPASHAPREKAAPGPARASPGRSSPGSRRPGHGAPPSLRLFCPGLTWSPVLHPRALSVAGPRHHGRPAALPVT